YSLMEIDSGIDTLLLNRNFIKYKTPTIIKKERDSMKVSQEIADKVEQWQVLQSQANNLYKELVDYFESESNIEGLGEPFIIDTPKGIKNSDDGEFCNQVTLGEDWFMGQYYFPIEDSDKYVGWSFEI
ncbi:MAG: hypothetical protein K2H53_02670, partial [Clostridia bacterium]|nr:hypothetical protein [Clostridia bacterium]